MSFQFCPKCGTHIGGKVACQHCGRMPTPEWLSRSDPPRGYVSQFDDNLADLFDPPADVLRERQP